MPGLSLGLDSSTQGLTAVVIDIDSGKKVFDKTLDYRADSRLNRFGINERYILPGEEGEADQPPKMFFASLDAMFEDMPLEVKRDIVRINTSGQQHGHVYLNYSAVFNFGSLGADMFFRHRPEGSDLVQVLEGSLAYVRAPTWMTSNTGVEADEIRQAVGGKQRMIELSGSDSPLRFTGTIIRKNRKKHGECLTQTEKIQLIGNLIPAILTGNSNVPADFANACGMSLMDYRKKEWSSELIDAVSNGLAYVGTHLRDKLPKLVKQ